MNNIRLENIFGKITVGVIAFGFLLSVTTLAQQSEAGQQEEVVSDVALMYGEAEKEVVAALTAAAKQDAVFLKFNVETRERYYLGEAPTIKLVLTNESGSEQPVYEAKHRQFELRGEGIFDNGDGEINVKKFEYEGSFIFPKTQEPKPGERFSWLRPLRRKPIKTKLQTNESTAVEVDLGKAFSIELFYPGKYKLTAAMKGGELETVAEFEIYFDAEKSAPTLEQKLREGSNGSGIAFHILRKYNRPKLIVVLEEMLQSDDLAQRERARERFSLLKQMDQSEMEKHKQRKKSEDNDEN